MSAQSDKILSGVPGKTNPADHRSGADRRRLPTPALSRFTFFGRRRKNRREDDPQDAYYVDWAAGPYLWMLYSVVLLVAFDAAATWMIISRGVQEGNPMIAFLLDLGPVAFWAGKLGLLPAFMVLLAVKRFFGWARFLVWIVFLAYAALAIFHLHGIWKVLSV